MEIKLSILGVRGGLPMPGGQFMEYGGNTSCLFLEYGEEALCFDAGSGLCDLCGRLPGGKRLHILISHVHMDHILGLYFLSALGWQEIHLYGEAGDGGSFRERLEAAIGRPYWPLGLCEMGRIQFHEVAGESFGLSGDEGGRIRIRTLSGNHPGGSLLYRAQLEGRSVTYALDCELEGDMAARLEEFARGSDLLVWDANFTRADKQPGWGHSTWEEGLAVGRAAGVGRILMTHFAREYTDSFLREQEELACGEDSNCVFAREGMVMEL